MISSTDLKLKLQELINNKKFTEAISLMEQNFPIADRPAGIFNLLAAATNALLVLPAFGRPLQSVWKSTSESIFSTNAP